MKAFIFCGGEVFPQYINEGREDGDLVIAADSGYKNALILGEKPNLLLGDFDSYTEKLPDNIEIIKVPAEKDFTDTQMAITEALKRGADEIVLIGGLSGRLDHTLSNLSVLPELWKVRIHAHATDGYNRIRYINSTSTLIPRSGFKYLSIIALTEKLKGVSIEGCKYPLKNATLFRANQSLSVSNEILENCALISIRKGEAFIIESRD